MSILTAFNNHFLEFVEDVQSIFPNDKDIRKAKAALEMLKKANPRLIIQVWKTQIVSHYRNQIEEQDVNFFLHKDYSIDVDGAESSNRILNAIERLREPIRHMGFENQKKCMKYVENLTKLSDLYNL